MTILILKKRKCIKCKGKRQLIDQQKSQIGDDKW